jgi:prophage regulatory protein
MLPTPQQLALRSQAPICIFDKSQVPKNVAQLFPGHPVITFETSEVPGEALFRLAAQLLKLVEQTNPDFFARRYEGGRCRGEDIFRLGSQLWKLIGPKWPDYFGRLPRQIVVSRIATQKKQSSRLLTYPELKSKKGIPYSRQHLARLEKEGKFPLRITLGPGRFGYYEHEIDKYVAERAEARRTRV